MEDDSCWKNIADGLALGVHVSNVDNLGCHETRCPTAHEQVLSLISVSGETKITDYDFQAVALLEHDVLRLQIPMNDPSFAQVLEPH